MLVKELAEIINGLAPFDSAEGYDNVGLVVGDENAEITGIMLALDATFAALDEMIALRANVLITHHPIMFSPVKRVLETTFEGKLVAALLRSHCHLIVAHTNWDAAPGGVNDTLAQLLELKNPVGERFLRVGDLPEPMTAAQFQGFLSVKLKAPALLMGDPNQLIHRVGVSSGAGDDEWREALALGADGFVAGEVKHHNALEATSRGMVLFHGGHFATENPSMDALGLSLQTALDKVKCNVAVYRTKAESFFVG